MMEFEVEKELEYYPVLSYQESLAMTGDFGPFQLYSCIVLMLAFTTKGFIFYGLPFLEKYPDYLCQGETGEWKACSRLEICGKQLPPN